MGNWEEYVRAHLYLPSGRRRFEDEIVADLCDQLEEAYQRALNRGADEEEARNEAHAYVGDWDELSERVTAGESPGLGPILEEGFDRTEQYLRSRGRLGGLCADFGWDIRFALRTFRRTPALIALIVLTLGLGIGANSAIFSLLNAVLLQPLPWEKPHELVEVNHSYLMRRDTSPVSVPTWHDIVTTTLSFRQAAICDRWITPVTGNDGPVLGVGAQISRDFFEILGASPLMGRTFRSEDHEPEAAGTIILGHGFWIRQMGGDPAVLGQTLTIEGDSYTVVGIMPADFSDCFEPQREFWVPLRLGAGDFAPERRIWGRYRLVARLNPGVTPEIAAREMRELALTVREEWPGFFPEEWTLEVTTLTDRLRGPYRSALLILGAAGVFVLLLICTNLAGLLLARALERRREVAIRQALGAGRPRLVRQFVTEGVVLSLLGGTAGIAVAFGCFDVIRRVAPVVLVSVMTTIGFEIFTVAMILSLLVGVVFGLTPVLHVWSERLTRILNEGGLASVSDRRRARYRNVLISLEFAITLILLVGSGLMIQSLGQLRRVDPGFETSDLLAVHLRLPPAAYPDAPSQSAFFDELLPAVASLPGVEAVATTSIVPFSGQMFSTLFRCEGTAPAESGRQDFDVLPVGELRLASPDLPRAMNFPVLTGRFFEVSDDPYSLPVTVVDNVLAERCWPGEDPIGKRITLSNPADPEMVWFTVIGVVSNLKDFALDSELRGQFYLPVRQVPWTDVALLIRTQVEPVILAPVLQAALVEVDPRLPMSNLVELDQLVARSIGNQRLLMMLLTLFGGFALFLAGLGVSGVVTCLIRARSREMGVRQALGASRSDLLRLLAKEGLLLVLIGLGIGLLGTVLMVRFLREHLYDISPFDPLTFLVVGFVILGVAVFAIGLPGRQVIRTDPAANLRVE